MDLEHKTVIPSKGLNVLSLCDGILCGRIAFERAGLKINKYFAAEIKDIAIKVTMNNYPDTIQIGNVNKISYKDGVLYTEKGNFKTHIDIVIFGSPCQSFSIAMKTEHRVGLKDKEKSGLFLECYRILKEINPKYFLMENVASMKDVDRDIITSMMGVKPLRFNSKLVAPALRDRYYWTNIPLVEMIKDKNIDFQSVLENGYTNRKKARSLLVSDSRPLTTPVKMFHRYYSSGFTTLIFKSEQHYRDCVTEYEKLSGGKRKISAKDLENYNGCVFNGIRYMYQSELEKCQTLPNGYTKSLTRNEAADVIGDGWTVDVIAHIFSSLRQCLS